LEVAFSEERPNTNPATRLWIDQSAVLPSGRAGFSLAAAKDANNSASTALGVGLTPAFPLNNDMKGDLFATTGKFRES
jgi:hypothetical protein